MPGAYMIEGMKPGGKCLGGTCRRIMLCIHIYSVVQ